MASLTSPALRGDSRLRILVLAAALALAACKGGGSGDTQGDPCASDADCRSLQCAADPEAKPKDLDPLTLACAKPGTGGKPGHACETARDCASGICLLAGSCATPCDDAAHCSDEEACQAVFARGAHDTLQSLSACVPRVSLPDDVTASSQVRTHALSAGDNAIELDAAEDSGATLYVLEHSKDDWPNDGECRPPLCVRTLSTRDAKPRLLFDAAADYTNDDPPLNPVATGNHVDPVTIAFPSGMRDALSSKGYLAKISAPHAGDLRVTRLSRKRSGDRLDLNVFYVGALDWHPQGTRGPELLADALDVVDEILGQADIAIGDVRQIDVPGELPERGTTVPEGDWQGFAVLHVRLGVYIELPALLRLSAGANNSAINLFFLRDIDPLAGDGEPEAEAGGIPGPLGMHGTAGSGIAIATDMMDGDPYRLGRTLAHEIAHYLGLFHTSEADGSVYDALADTPECRTDRDKAGDGLDADDCTDAGADNLMFWARTDGTKLTADQIAVLKRALILQ